MSTTQSQTHFSLGKLPHSLKLSPVTVEGCAEMSRKNYGPKQILEEAQGGRNSSPAQPAPSVLGNPSVPRIADKEERAEVPNSGDTQSNCKEMS